MLLRARTRLILRWALVLAISLLVVEGAVRARHRLKFGTWGRIYQFELDEASGLTIPKRNQRTRRLSTNSHGFRGDEIAMQKPPGRLRIGFLGGSTTFCAEATSDQATWPSIALEHIRANLPERDFDAINAGVGGYTLAHMRTNLERRLAPFDPDVVVIYEATNDLSHDTRELAERQDLYTFNEDDDSWISFASLTWFLVDKNLSIRWRAYAAARETRRLEYDPDELARGFEQRLTELVRSAQSRASLVALVTFAPRLRREQSPDEQLLAARTSLYFMPYMTPRLVLDGFEAYNRAIRRVADATGALLIEAENQIPADAKHYNDSVHLKDAGLERLGRLVADGLLASDRFRGLNP